MTKSLAVRALHLAVRLAVIASLVILSVLPPPFLDRLVPDRPNRVAHAVPIVVATKTDQLLVDLDENSVANPGDTLSYTVVITNTGTTDASSVSFVDTIDANTTLVPGSLRTTPIARHDTYSALGNVGITVPAGSGLLVNDNDADGSPVSVVGIDGCADATAPFVCPAATSNGGDVTLHADGSFTYTPPPGFESTDQFRYFIQDGDGNLDPATVFVVVQDMIWFIDNTAAAGGNGRLDSPFNSLAAFNSSAADDPGDAVFVYSGSGPYTGGIVLQSNQMLIGQGASDSITTITGFTLPPFSNALPATGGSKPVLENNAGDGIALAANNLVRGLTAGNASASSIAGSSAGSLTISEVIVNNPSGGGIEIAGGTLSVALESLNATSSGDEGIDLTNVSGSFVVAAGSIANTNSRAVRIDGAPSLALNVTLTSVSASNADAGILLQDTTGSFTVTGSGTTDGSGGTLQNLNDHGLELINAANVSISNMNLTNAALTQEVAPNTPTCTNAASGTNTGCNAPVFMQNASGASFANLTINGSVQHGIAGNSVTGLTLSGINISNIGNEYKENGLHFINLLGTVSFDNLTVDGSHTRNALIENNTGVANISITNSTFNNAGAENGLDFLGLGTANITFSVSGSSFTHNRGVQLRALAEDNSTIDATITGNAFDGDPAVSGNLGIDLDAVEGGTLTFDVIGTSGAPQTFQPFRSHAINVFASGGGTASGTVSGNTILGSAFGAGVRAVAEVNDVGGLNPNITIEIRSNSISDIGGGGLAGIHVVSRDGTSGVTGTANVQATIDGNSVTINGADSVIQGLANGGNTLCLDVTNNVAGGASTSPFAPFGSTHYIGNPVPGDSLGPGTVLYDGYVSGDLGSTWNLNGNSPSLAAGNGGEAYVDGTQPTAGTCAVIVAADQGLYQVNLPAGPSPVEAADAVPFRLGSLVDPLREAAAGFDSGALLASARDTAGSWAASLLTDLGGAFQATPAYASGETINVSLGTLNAGQVVVITFDVTVDSTIPAGVSQVCNQGVFQGANFADLSTDDPDVSGVKDPTCTPVEVSRVDLVVSKNDSVDAVAAGDVLQYTIAVTNTGQATASSVLLTETVPANTTFDEAQSATGWSCADGAPAGTQCVYDIGAFADLTYNSSAHLVFAVKVDRPIAAGATQIVNTIEAGDDGASGPDANPGDNSATETTPLVFPDLVVSKNDSVDSAAAGEIIQYSIKVTNTGAALSSGVLLTETVPANTTFDADQSTAGWSCADGAPAGTECVYDIGAFADLTYNSSAHLVFAVEVDASVPAFLPNIVNSVEAGDDGASGPDANLSDNSATETTPLIAAPDLQVSKSDEGTAPPGTTLTYTIVYTNAGDRGSTSAIISETVPAHTTWDPAQSTAGWACNPASGVAGTNCTINVGTVDGAGAGGSVVFAVSVDSALPAGVTETTNEVEIYGSSASADSNPDDNRFSLVTQLNGPPEITGIAPAEQTVQYSDLIATVTITASDSGPDPLTLSAASALPDNLSLSTASCSVPPGGSGQECTWTLSGQMLEAAGPTVVEVAASDGTLTSEPAFITLTVEHEDATVTFDGANPVSVPVAEAEGDSEPFSLVFDLTEFDNPDDVAGDGNLAGDIGLAGVTVALVPVGPGGSESPTSCSDVSSLRLADPDSPYDYDLRTLSCNFDAVPVNTYAVEVTIGGDYYAGSGEDVLVVYDPSLGFTTGGGWFYWPGTSDRTNVGYTMKYNKKGQKVQGSLLLIRHLADGTTYRLKSNAIDGLALGDEGDYGWATFTGKATYLEPGWPDPVGSHQFVAYVEDHGEPGAGADKFWIEIRDKDGGLVTLSLDRDAAANAQLLEGGNIVVPHGDGGGRGRGRPR